MKLIFTSVIALALLASGTTAAFAASQNNLRFASEGRTATVKFADLDLANPADAKILVHRIHATARKVCLNVNPINRLESMQERRHCIAESYSNGVAVINTRRGIDVEALAARATSNREIVGAD